MVLVQRQRLRGTGFDLCTTPVDLDIVAVWFGPFGDIHRADKRMPFITEIYVELESFRAVQEALEEAGYKMDESSLIFDPTNRMELSHAESMQVMNLIERIEELDDVQNVYSALEMSDELLAAMEEA